MIEERALVIEAGDDWVWVETRRRTACSACNVQTSCGSGALAELLGNRRTRVRALTSVSLQVGDEVMIGLHENALLKSALAVYMVPLLFMLLGAMLGQTAFAAAGEEMVIVLGAAGLLAGFVWLRIFTLRISTDAQFQPVVLRQLAPSHSSLAADSLPAPIE